MSQQPDRGDQLLDLLLDALAERQARRGVERVGAGEALNATATHVRTADVQADDDSAMGHVDNMGRGVQLNAPTHVRAAINEVNRGQVAEDMPRKASADLPSPSVHSPLPTSPLHLGRLCLLLGLLVVLVNVPFTGGGLSLAHLVPSTASLIIRDGLVLKGPGPEIYVLQENQLRWISSLEAFEYFGYRWAEVHVVEAAFLNQFARGAPLSVLLKCDGSPNIYALENDHKRWIKDIPTFTAQGFVWTDVKVVDCDYLDRLPLGVPIPEDAGTPR